MYVRDAVGRRTGADPSSGLTDIGLGNRIEEIPLSQVMSDNIRDDETELPSVASTWQVGILDSGAQTYTVHLQGMVTGVSWVRVGMNYEPALNIPKLPIVMTHVLVSPGVERLLTVVFDPDGRLLKAHRVVTGGGLVADLETACQLKLIGPAGICRSLKAKADAASAALSRGNTQAARGSLQAFLKELNAQNGKRIKEPALTILREEAEALLNSPPAPKKIKARSTR